MEQSDFFSESVGHDKDQKKKKKKESIQAPE